MKRMTIGIALWCVMVGQSGLAQPANIRSVNSPSNGTRLQINRAIYGYNGKGDDVTNRVRAQIRNNRVIMEVNNDTMGGDPNHGAKKNLKVVYTYAGRQQTRFVNEHDWLRIP
jgi:hypothetical protein